MTYRRLGRSGLKVSVLSFGSWVSFGDQLDVESGAAGMEAAYEVGVNFFDNAEVYAGGKSEQIMGDIIADLGWERHSYVISSTFMMGIHGGLAMSDIISAGFAHYWGHVRLARRRHPRGPRHRRPPPPAQAAHGAAAVQP